MSLRLFIIAGEASGDAHGGKLAAAMLAREPTLILEGVGGAAMEKAGVRLLHDIRHLGVVGVVEVLSQWRAIWRTYRAVRDRLTHAPPAAIVLIDYPDFNLRIARIAKRLEIPVMYYVSPQIWAWRPRRIATISARVDMMLVLFRFELDLYRRAGVPCRWVGHPLLDETPPETDGPAVAWRHGREPGERVLALLPGSRALEVTRLLPVMLEAARRLHESGAADRVVVAAAPTVDLAAIEAATARMGSFGAHVTVVPGEAAAVLRASTAAIVASGTATLQAAVIGTPMVVVYRVSGVTAWIARRLVTAPHIALVNVVAGRMVVPELMQERCTPEGIVSAVRPLLMDARAAAAMRGQLAGVRDALGEPGASARAAQVILGWLAQGVGRV